MENHRGEVVIHPLNGSPLFQGQNIYYQKVLAAGGTVGLRISPVMDHLLNHFLKFSEIDGLTYEFSRTEFHSSLNLFALNLGFLQWAPCMLMNFEGREAWPSKCSLAVGLGICDGCR